MCGKVVIVDYGMGNLFSLHKKMRSLKVDVVVSSSVDEIVKAQKLILPGVGHFGKAMENLVRLGLVDTVNELAMVRKIPVLGICLGMQLMAKHSMEGNVAGLGWFDAEVVRFNHTDAGYRIPHMGWNTITIKKESTLMKNITEEDEFYFVHSYHYTHTEKSVVLNETTYEYTFCSAIEKDNIFGVQYHPEKSHDSGDKLLKNFLTL